MKSINLIWPVSALLLVVAMGIHAVLSFNAANAQIELDILNTARTLRDLLSTMRTFNIQQCPYSDPPLPDPSSESRMHHALPGLPEEVLRFDNMPIVFGLASDLASGPASQEGSHEDKTERELIHWFRANPHREERLIKVQGDREPAFYYYAIPIRAEVACLRCHGAKATVPIAFENQPRFNMGIEPGEPLGIFGMRFPDSQGQALDILLWEQAVQLGGILLMLAFGGLILSRRQARRLQEFTVAALRIGEGDYAARLAKAGSTALVDSFNRMAVAIQNREGTNRESLGRIQALFANMSEGFALNRLIRDERGQPVDFLILEVNGNFEAHTKLHAADVVGRLASEVYGSNEPPCLAAIAQAIDMGAPLRVQCCFASLRRHFEVSISPQGDDEFATLFTDITEHMVAELALGASEARENSIFTAAPVGIGMTINRVIIEANETLFRMTGYSREELIGLSARQLYSSEQEYERVGKVKYAQIRERGIGTVETQWKRKDGSLLEVSLSSSPLDPTNLGKGVTFTAQDISEKRQAEAALRENEVKFHTMVDWTYDWEYWVNPDGSFHYMTPSVERVTGYDLGAFERNPQLIDAIVHPEDRQLWESHIHHHLPTHSCEEIVELDFRIIRKQGDIRWVTHTCRPVCDHGQSYLGRRVTVRDITARKDAEEQIRHLAYFDHLTGLPNRRLLLDRLGQALIASNRSEQHGALLLLDLDHFKALNDTQGHMAGDRLLVEVTRRLRGCVRQENTVSRLGGDEYVVMLENLGLEEATAALQAEVVAAKVRNALNEPYTLEGVNRDHHITSSIGVTLFRGQKSPIEVILKQAEVALYQAKDAGRNAVRFFNPAMQATIDWRIGMENALRRGLREREFRLFYQPQTDQKGRLIGAEALLRWMPSGQAPVSPAHFIPLAEETGLILPLGQWVVDTACDQLKAWENHLTTRSLRIAINVSARQFHQPDFVDLIRASLQRSGANPTLLKLELTESVVLNNIDEVIQRMEQLRALGVGFALDDFGTGYSSLSYLKRLPLDQLKIDQSFVRDIPRDANDSAIVRAILAMCQSLDLEVLAEGVETAEQRDFLRENGCLAYQGFLFGRPMAIGDWDQVVLNGC